MSSYNNMSVAGDTPEEPLEADIDNDVPSPEPEPAENTPNNDGNDNKTTDENQLAGMLIVVWVLIIIGVIVFVASTIIKKREAVETKTVYVEVASNMLSMDGLQAEEQNWTDYLTLEKKIQTTGTTITYYLSGKATNYGKTVNIPVTQEEFDSVVNGATIEFVFSRLKIEGKEYITIRRWSVYDKGKD